MTRGFLAIDRAALALCDSEPEVVCLMLMARRQDSRWSESNRTPDVEVGRSYWCERTGLSEWDLRRFVDRLVAAGRAVITHPGDRRTVKRIRLVVDIAEARVTTDPRTDPPPTHGQPPTPDNGQIHRPSTDPRTDLPPQELASTIEESIMDHEGKGEREGATLTTPPTPDATASVPPADLTPAWEASDAPTTDPTPEHVNKTNAGDRAEEGDVPSVVSGGLLGEGGIYTPSPEVGLFGGKWRAAVAPEVAPAPAPTPEPVVPLLPVAEAVPIEPAPEKPKRARKERPPPDELAEAAAEAKREEERFHRSVTDCFGEAFKATFGTRYPWCFKGRDHDGTKRGIWIAQAKIAKTDPDPGLARLRGAALAYCRAVAAGRAFPYGEPATTHHFTRELGKWLQTDPNARHAPTRVNGRPAMPSIAEILAEAEAYDLENADVH